MRRRKEASALVDVVSSEWIQSVKLSKFQETSRAAKEVKERSNEAGFSSWVTVVELVEADMTSTHGINYLATFKTFAGIISTKFDVFEITSSWAEQSFIFRFWHIIQVILLPLSLFFFILDLSCSDCFMAKGFIT